MDVSHHEYDGLIKNIKELKEKLQATEEHLKVLSDVSLDWFWATDDKMRFTEVSGRYFEITGVPANDVIGKTRFDLVPEKEQNRRPELWKKHLEDLQNRRPFRNFEYGIQGIHSLTRYVRINGKPVFSSQGDFLGYVGTGTDETERIETQIALEQTKVELLQSEKLASIGQLAAGAAHEINTPIGFIKLNLQALDEYTTDLLRLIEKQQEILKDNKLSLNPKLVALEQEVELDYIKEDLPSLIQQSNEGINKISYIINQLREHSSSDDEQYSMVDINQILKHSISEITPACTEKNIKVCWELTELPLMKGLAHQLEQLFINLLKNAEQSITDNGIINIATRIKHADTVIQVEIHDNGKGMDADVARRIYDPFFTTKEVGEGSGLGLSMAQGIIQSHQGSISVESEPGVGTVFRLEIPYT
ncbi:PAS domain-containing sensor histidine kinase [Sedimenticola selenatireducens]|uniref:histidine kinase n=1 Tax=Sedimenticola selenatireducens TaxID=191960 RepID=A0A558DPW5_9GAMM|nr:ATP-binding protein [Sedimenticola selenatireducens]TVO70473.1 PAS domain S-box protein [Sedimenticola selenatireducens]TVT63050.1 MAG: PAS domain S-box protein [Sedimenticola selenatireducens]